MSRKVLTLSERAEAIKLHDSGLDLSSHLKAGKNWLLNKGDL
jgi:hypothetical protein